MFGLLKDVLKINARDRSIKSSQDLWKFKMPSLSVLPIRACNTFHFFPFFHPFPSVIFVAEAYCRLTTLAFAGKNSLEVITKRDRVPGVCYAWPDWFKLWRVICSKRGTWRKCTQSIRAKISHSFRQETWSREGLDWLIKRLICKKLKQNLYSSSTASISLLFDWFSKWQVKG